MIILGIDPGYAIVGYGVVSYDNRTFTPITYGAVTTEAGLDADLRLEQVYDGISAVIVRYQPDAIAIEQLFFTNNKTTGIMVAQARGVILLAARKKGVPTYEYTPMQVKQSVVGYGKAEKRQVMLMTQHLLHMKEIPKPDDAADALALAICHSRAATSLLNTDREFDPAKYDTR